MCVTRLDADHVRHMSNTSRLTEKAKPCEGFHADQCALFRLSTVEPHPMCDGPHRPGATSQGSLDWRCIGAELLHGGYWLKVHYHLALVECATCGSDG